MGLNIINILLLGVAVALSGASLVRYKKTLNRAELVAVVAWAIFGGAVLTRGYLSLGLWLVSIVLLLFRRQIARKI